MEFNFRTTINESFDELKKPLVSGQHFRTDVYSDELVFVYKEGVYRMMSSEDGTLILGTKVMDINRFFDLDRDYKAIMAYLINLDDHMKKAVEQFEGLRILKQDPFEMVMTFIISQSKQIPQIKILVERISEVYGNFIGRYRDKDYYSFPRPDQLANVDESIYRALRLGYRGAYLADAVELILSGRVNLDAIYDMSYELGMDMLMQIKGVGEKVADCVMLYGYGDFRAFPVDVWIERVVNDLYFEDKVSKKEIRDFVSEHFRPLEGIAQQYLFEYGRYLANKN